VAFDQAVSYPREFKKFLHLTGLKMSARFLPRAADQARRIREAGATLANRESKRLIRENPRDPVGPETGLSIFRFVET
jgi:hypothetical protein